MTPHNGSCYVNKVRPPPCCTTLLAFVAPPDLVWLQPMEALCCYHLAQLAVFYSICLLWMWENEGRPITFRVCFWKGLPLSKHFLWTDSKTDMWIESSKCRKNSIWSVRMVKSWIICFCNDVLNNAKKYKRLFLFIFARASAFDFVQLFEKKKQFSWKR